ncbi:MAG: dihydrolipoamide acetyltransferase family protein, partial [Anaerolineales bacterium]
TVEVESPASGVVKGWMVEEGKPVPVGALMAVIGTPDEVVDMQALSGAPAAAESQPPAAEAKPAPAAETKPAPESNPAEAKPVEAKPVEAKPAPAANAHGNGHQEGAIAAARRGGAAAPASPIARKMAAEAGADLSQITGTGPGGRITKKDVETYLSQPKPAAPEAAPAAAARPAVAVPLAAREDQSVPLTRMRQIIARRMTESTTTIPQFYVNTKIDMAAAMDLRKQLNALVSEDGKLSVNDLVIKAVALALRDFPNLNASFAGDKVIRKGHINVGNAVAIEAGLLTVVVRDADQKPLSLIAAEMKAMVARVRDGKVQGADIEGSTFSISNLGKWDVDSFLAIINPPEAAILAVGTVKQVPVVQNGAIVPGLRMLASLSADHRVTDGAEAAAFMQALKAKLEAPLRLVL